MPTHEDRGECEQFSGHDIFSDDDEISVCLQHCLQLPPHCSGLKSLGAASHRFPFDHGEVRLTRILKIFFNSIDIFFVNIIYVYF